MTYQNLFKIQTPSSETIFNTVKNNLLIDYSFGYEDIITAFCTNNAQYNDWMHYIRQMTKDELSRHRNTLRKNTLLMTVLMLTGRCNADCEICYTDRDEKNDNITFEEIKCALDQTTNLGSKLIYIPGEGEPFLDKNIWKVLDYAKENDLKVIIFTNGILFSNNEICKQVLGENCDKIIQRLSNYPVYVYFKLWSLSPDKNAIMMNIPKDTITYIKHKQYNLPQGLTLLLKYLRKEQVGIESVIDKINILDIKNEILPLVKELNIRSFIEPIIHSGRCFNNFNHDPAYNDLIQLPGIPNRECHRMSYKIVIHNDGSISPGIAIKTKNILSYNESKCLNIKNVMESNGDIFDLLHSNDFLVASRYHVNGCLCEKMNLAFAKTASEIL